jgi:hypothetical protein
MAAVHQRVHRVAADERVEGIAQVADGLRSASKHSALGGRSLLRDGRVKGFGTIGCARRLKKHVGKKNQPVGVVFGGQAFA